MAGECWRAATSQEKKPEAEKMGNPEQDARRQIDQLLVQAGWHVCDVVQANITAYRGVAIREFPLPGQSHQKTTLHVPQKYVVHVCSAVHAITARSQGHA